uniref:Beta-lactamase-related domain-containing protein n=1 Tax=Percolomonas cosmopolitus TaxID=63605 RepID=A0A7S1PGW9_9EUKA
MHLTNLFMVSLNIILLALVVIGVAASSSSDRKTSDFRPVDQVIHDAIKDGAFPGAVILIASKDGIMYQNAYGSHTYSASAPSMRLSTLFDLASVTKVIATTTAVAQLYQKKILDLDMKVGGMFPEFNNHGKDIITLRHLLLHNSGFKPDPVPGFHTQTFGCPESAKKHPQLSFSCLSQIYDGIMNQPLMNPVGAKYVYSDLSMMTAHLMIGRATKIHNLVSESDLRKDCPTGQRGEEACYYEAYVRKYVLQSLNLKVSGFLPPHSEWSNCAPAWNETGSYRHELIQGFVSDPNSYANGGIMGHAGLFSTTGETFEVLKAWMYQAPGEDYISEATAKLFSTVANVTQSSRALGWDTNSDGYGSCGHLSPSTFLHLGYTGTQVCNDPERGIITMLFTNRVYPTAENTKIGKVRSNFNDAVLCSLEKKYCE